MLSIALKWHEYNVKLQKKSIALLVYGQLQ